MSQPRPLSRICVFAGSSCGCAPRYTDAAVALVDELGRRRISIVYGGGRLGLMKVVADAAVERGVEIVGVIPRGLAHFEIANHDLDDLRVVSTMHERKVLMGELADAFVSLPGGFGTLEETIEALTWTLLGFHTKPVALLNVGRFWDAFDIHLDHAVVEGFIGSDARRHLLRSRDPSALLDRLESWEPPGLDPRLQEAAR
jgi:uncharacterized protein (TIGR00730 family)